MTLPDSYRQHLLSRLTSDLLFLRDEGVLSAADHSAINLRLDSARSGSVDALSGGVSGLNVGVGAGSESVGAGRGTKQCRALWDYPQGGAQPDDLQFTKGDMISIEEETNADWWRGNCNGHSGIFPTAYVEVVETPSGANRQPPPPPMRTFNSGSSSVNSYQQPKQEPQWGGNSYAQSQQAPYQQSFNPPQPAPYQPSYGSYNNNNEKQPYQAPPPAQQQQYVPPAAPFDQPPQQIASGGAPPIPKKKFGLGSGTGKLMATSFAGGLGFGAGAAVAGDVVNSIF